MRFKASIQGDVNPADAYRLVMNARGVIAAHLRMAAVSRSEWDVWMAEGHGAVKHARDTRKRVQRLELQRRGWK